MSWDRVLRGAIFVLVVLVIGACGGGGGSVSTPPATLVGRVLNVTTGGPVSPSATIQVGNATTTTRTDGSFQLNVPAGTTEIAVVPTGFAVFRFTIPAANGTQDVGDLWVGPEQVTVTGRVLNASNQAPIAGADVSFAGRTALTNPQGTFRLTGVAYSSAALTAFWGIRGTARASDFFPSDWNTQPNVAQNGTVTVADVLLAPEGSDNPPPPPHNVWGRIAPSADAPGSRATLKQSGTAVRTYNVGTDGNYYFWVVPGTYTVEVTKDSRTATVDVTLTATNEVVRRDVTLP